MDIANKNNEFMKTIQYVECLHVIETGIVWEPRAGSVKSIYNQKKYYSS